MSLPLELRQLIVDHLPADERLGFRLVGRSACDAVGPVHLADTPTQKFVRDTLLRLLQRHDLTHRPEPLAGLGRPSGEDAATSPRAALTQSSTHERPDPFRLRKSLISNAKLCRWLDHTVQGMPTPDGRSLDVAAARWLDSRQQLDEPIHLYLKSLYPVIAFAELDVAAKLWTANVLGGDYQRGVSEQDRQNMAELRLSSANAKKAATLPSDYLRSIVAQFFDDHLQQMPISSASTTMVLQVGGLLALPFRAVVGIERMLYSYESAEALRRSIKDQFHSFCRDLDARPNQLPGVFPRQFLLLFDELNTSALIKTITGLQCYRNAQSASHPGGHDLLARSTLPTLLSSGPTLREEMIAKTPTYTPREHLSHLLELGFDSILALP